MSDHTYDNNEPVATENFVTVAQTASPNLVLTKRNYSNGIQKPYDQAKYFNFYEVQIWNLYDLYLLSKRMLSKSRCCFIRARIKDSNKVKRVTRTYKDQDATLILQNQNWFALDIDGFARSSGDLISDAKSVILALPSCFASVQCFVVASSSYGIKSDIRMRMFFWSDEPCSHLDLKRLLHGNSANADLAIFNPIQPIYTAAPIFHGMIDPIRQRIAWLPQYALTVSFNVDSTNHHGAPELVYTKQTAERMRHRKLVEIGFLTSGARHNGVIRECIFFGQLIEQGVLEESETIELIWEAMSNWYGHRNTKKDMETILWAIERGKLNMGRNTL